MFRVDVYHCHACCPECKGTEHSWKRPMCTNIRTSLGGLCSYGGDSNFIAVIVGEA